MTHDELLELPIRDRDWYLARVAEQREADEKTMREASARE